MPLVSLRLQKVLSWSFENLLLTAPAGFSLPSILRTVQNLTQGYMNAQQTNSSVGGYSMVALVMPGMGMINDADSSYGITQLQYLSEQVPDLKFIYYTGGTVNRFNNFVRDPTQDLFAVNTGATPAVSSGPVLRRIIRSKLV